MKVEPIGPYDSTNGLETIKQIVTEANKRLV